jgi:hypothetical protein
VNINGTIGKCIYIALGITPFIVLLAWALRIDELTLLLPTFEVVVLFMSYLPLRISLGKGDATGKSIFNVDFGCADSDSVRRSSAPHHLWDCFSPLVLRPWLMPKVLLEELHFPCVNPGNIRHSEQWHFKRERLSLRRVLRW